MPFNPAQLPDLVLEIQDTIWEQKKWNDISQTLQYMGFVDRFFKGKKLNTRSGDVITWPIQVKGQDNFLWRRIYEPTTGSIPGDLFRNASVNWAICQDEYSLDEIEKVFMSDNIRVIVDFIVGREHAMYMNWFEKLETAMWTNPAGPGDVNNANPFLGIPHWVVRNATEGFNGGNPANFTAGAGNISSSDYPNWSNWSGTYSSVNNRDDFIAKLRKSDRRTKFIPPHAYNSSVPEEKQLVRYSTEAVVEGLAKYLDSRADNIRDAAGTQGVGDGVFNGKPIQWIPALDTDASKSSYVTYDPIYSIDWATTQLVFQEGQEMRRLPPIRRPLYNTVWDMFIIAIAQLFCIDRRRQSVLYRG